MIGSHHIFCVFPPAILTHSLSRPDQCLATDFVLEERKWCYWTPTLQTGSQLSRLRCFFINAQPVTSHQYKLIPNTINIPPTKTTFFNDRLMSFVPTIFNCRLSIEDSLIPGNGTLGIFPRNLHKGSKPYPKPVPQQATP